MEIKQNTAVRVPVRLTNASDGAGATGVLYSDVSVFLQKQAGAAQQKALVASDWTEIDGVNMPGVYDLLLTIGETDTQGFFKYSVAKTGLTTYLGLLEVVADVESDTLARLGTPAGASVSADIAAIKAKVDTVPLNPLLVNDARLPATVIAAKADTDAIAASVSAMAANVLRLLGLSLDNVLEDQHIYDTNGKLTNVRMRCYDSAGNANSGGSTGLLFTYNATAVYDGNGRVTRFTLVRG